MTGGAVMVLAIIGFPRERQDRIWRSVKECVYVTEVGSDWKFTTEARRHGEIREQAASFEVSMKLPSQARVAFSAAIAMNAFHNRLTDQRPHLTILFLSVAPCLRGEFRSVLVTQAIPNSSE
jgi:hypothetical protein